MNSQNIFFSNIILSKKICLIFISICNCTCSTIERNNTLNKYIQVYIQKATFYWHVLVLRSEIMLLNSTLVIIMLVFWPMFG